MKFTRRQTDSSIEINMIPLIDVLLVIVIFLVVNTTFIQKSKLNVELPGTSAAEQSNDKTPPLIIRVSQDGNFDYEGQLLLGENALKQALASTIRSIKSEKDSIRAVIEADASSTHQSVVTVMDVLASLGVARVSIATSNQ